MKRRTVLSLLFAALVLSLNAQAEELSGRLKRIKDTGTLVLGHGETSVPFSYSYNGKPVGLGVDISLAVAEAIKAHLGLQDLRIRWNPMTLSTRFPLMVTNTVDLECTATTNTQARQQTVAFSNTFFISEEGIATRRNGGIKDYGDLNGKTVIVVGGTTTEKSVRALATEQGLNINLLVERSNRRAATALVEGKADAYVAAKPILAGQLLRQKATGDFQIVGQGRYKEAFGCMLPKGEEAFKKVVDGAIAKLMTSGEMERLYNKWFLNSIAPFSAKVDLPLSDENRRLYGMPNDTAFE